MDLKKYFKKQNPSVAEIQAKLQESLQRLAKLRAARTDLAVAALSDPAVRLQVEKLEDVEKQLTAVMAALEDALQERGRAA